MKDLSISIFAFIVELLKSVDFVKVEDEEYSEPTNAEIKQGIKQGVRKCSLSKATPLNDFLDEL